MLLNSKWATAGEEDSNKIEVKSSPLATAQRRDGILSSKWAQEDMSADADEAKEAKVDGQRSKKGNTANVFSRQGYSSGESDSSSSRPSTSGSDSCPRSQMFEKLPARRKINRSEEAVPKKPNELARRLGLEVENLKERPNSRREERRGFSSPAEKTSDNCAPQGVNPLAFRLGLVSGDKKPVDSYRLPRASSHDTNEGYSGSERMLRKTMLKRKIMEQQRVQEQKQLLEDFLNSDAPLDWDEGELVGQLDKLNTGPQ